MLVRSVAEAVQRGQAERILPLVEAVLADAGWSWPQLDLLAVTVGPADSPPSAPAWRSPAPWPWRSTGRASPSARSRRSPRRRHPGRCWRSRTCGAARARRAALRRRHAARRRAAARLARRGDGIGRDRSFPRRRATAWRCSALSGSASSRLRRRRALAMLPWRRAGAWHAARGRRPARCCVPSICVLPTRRWPPGGRSWRRWRRDDRHDPETRPRHRPQRRPVRPRAPGARCTRAASRRPGAAPTSPTCWRCRAPSA